MALPARALVLALAVLAAGVQPPPTEQVRIQERLRALRQEADELAAREKSLLTDLRRAELERDITTELRKDADHALAAATQDLADTTTHLTAVEQRAADETPGLSRRLVELYKLGGGGYVRLLLSVDNVREMGRAYRTVASLAALDKERVRAHQSTLASLRAIRAELETRRTRAATAEADARKAALAATAAVSARTALLDQIDAQRDLNARFVSELQSAQQKLSDTVSALPANGSTVPIRPFQGSLDWPAVGRVTARFGPGRGSRFGTAITRSGIEIAAPAGAPVTAVHEGTVAFASPFSGFGTLVILDHGAHAYSLYGYLSSVAVTKGAHVDRGARVGLVGSAPAGQPALYFEMRVDGKAVDPLQWLKPRY
jgi:septal ring factor EnvC (AmiA/AmiB activator)